MLLLLVVFLPMSLTSVTLPKVLLMGLCKSGKSSIQKVVFEGMQPHECVNLLTTVHPNKSEVSHRDLMVFEVWDFPGQSDLFDPNNPTRYDPSELLHECGAVVFVMDCRELIEESRARLIDVLCAAHLHGKELCVEVFIHKVDALTEEQQTHLLATLQRDVEFETNQRLGNSAMLSVNFSLTSIYDHSVFKAFSHVVQRLIRFQVPYITELLQMVNSNSNVDYSYLFLSRSKIFLSFDGRQRVKAQTYELCSDAISMVEKMSQLCLPVAGERQDSYNYSEQMSVEAAVNKGSHTLISLSNGDCIYVKELPTSLTIVMMAKSETFKNKALIDYNIFVLYKALFGIFEATANSLKVT